jgi:hypothetical protein
LQGAIGRRGAREFGRVWRWNSRPGPPTPCADAADRRCLTGLVCEIIPDASRQVVSHGCVGETVTLCIAVRGSRFAVSSARTARVQVTGFDLEQKETKETKPDASLRCLCWLLWNVGTVTEPAGTSPTRSQKGTQDRATGALTR